MADTRLHLLHFPRMEPQWLILDGGSLTPIEAPDPKAKIQLLALLPDSFFFYYQPVNLQTKNERTLRAAARLQIQHTFPPLPEGWEVQFFRAVKGRLLGYMSKPELRDFLDLHQAALARANTVTTALALTWFAAQMNDIAPWIWQGPGGEHVLADTEKLFYFRAGFEELKDRIRAFAPQGESPTTLDLESVLTNLAAQRPKWSRFRIPLQIAREETLETSTLVRTGAVVTGVALLFLIGQFLRLNVWSSRANDLRQETKALYSAALGPDIGGDPYGKLLFSLDQLRTGGSQGFDVLECLRALSANAPESLTVEGINFSGDSGVVTGFVKTYDQVDRFMEGLKGQTRFQFTLDQAVNTDKGIRLNLRVAMLR